MAHVSHVLPDGRTLLDDASFRIGEGITAALVGPNGAGKTTLLRLIAGDAQPQQGVITATGTLGVMRQFIGGPATAGLTVRDLLLSVAPQQVRDAAGHLDDAELAMMERDDEPAQLGYAKALNDYAEAGGYDAEVHWDECCVAGLGKPYDEVRWRAVSTLSGGDEEQAKLKELVRAYRQKASHNSDMASRLQAAVTRLEKFEAAGPPELPPREQHIRVRLKGGRTGRRAVMCAGLAVAGTTRPFDAEIWYGDRIAVLGANGSGKSSFLRLLAGEPLAHEGTWKLGARVVPGMFAQTHARPDLDGRTPAEILMTSHALLVNEAMAALARYELHKCARQPFGTLSGGQQARLQILLLELGGATLLLLDEPTDNLDLPSADALQAGLEAYQGTVLAVTHDRWFARSLDSCLVFGSDGTVRQSAEPDWDLRSFSERTRCDSPSYSLLY